MKRNILLCVAGGTPAIITETLWALKEKGERVDEIRVITTSEGRRKILQGILIDEKGGVRGAADESLLDAKDGKFYKFQQDFPKYADKIVFDEKFLYVLTTRNKGVPNPRDGEEVWMQDILTDDDNAKIANQICEIVRELAADENVRIHASIAGGRKTMGLYLMTAMQLFGRNEDKMSHVLVSKDVEFGAPKFFYKPENPEAVLAPNGIPKIKADGTVLTTGDVGIYLADIPFIRLRGIGSTLISQSIENYAEIVKQAQENLESLSLRIDLKNSSVKIGRKAVKFEPQQFFVYVLFAYLRLKKIGSDGFLQPDEITLNDFDTVCRLISKAKGDELGYADFDFLRSDSLQKLNCDFFQSKNPKKGSIYVSEIVKMTYQVLVSDIRRVIRNAALSDEYAVSNLNFRRKNVEAVYGLKIQPNRIQFETA